MTTHYYNGSAILAFTPSYIDHHHHHILHRRGIKEIKRIQDLFGTNNNGDYYDYDEAINKTTTTKSTTTTTTTTTTQEDQDDHRSSKDYSNIGLPPKHVGIICDGNSRWATARNLPTSFGHAEGGRRLIDLIKRLVQEKSNNYNSNFNNEDNNNEHNNDMTECVTFYAFSTENWNRSKEEIKNIYTVLELTGQTMLLFDPQLLNGLCIQILGDLDDVRIPTTCRSVMKKLVERTNRSNNSNNNGNNNKKLTICFGINYGGRRDILFACKEIVQQVQDGILTIHEITEETISNNLCTSSLQQRQNLDLIIRTGGENRLSNFMIWESAYSEIYISTIFWPNFTYEDEWSTAMEWYKKRKRNFGGRTT
jgi:undecaprenyl diphosphate synthase